MKFPEGARDLLREPLRGQGEKGELLYAQSRIRSTASGILGKHGMETIDGLSLPEPKTISKDWSIFLAKRRHEDGTEIRVALTNSSDGSRLVLSLDDTAPEYSLSSEIIIDRANKDHLSRTPTRSALDVFASGLEALEETLRRVPKNQLDAEE